jgi:hypothetical protein
MVLDFLHETIVRAVTAELMDAFFKIFSCERAKKKSPEMF